MSKHDKHEKAHKKDKNGGERSPFKAGVAVGIGSAAIVAALIYARSGKAKKK
jgi:hypothetical protein